MAIALQGELRGLTQAVLANGYAVVGSVQRSCIELLGLVSHGTVIKLWLGLKEELCCTVGSN
jgi:hypothetical protein